MEQPASLPGTGFKPFLSLQRHARLSLLLFVLVWLIGVPVVWLKGRSTYSAEAIFQVAPRYMKNLESDQEVEMQSNQQYREFVNHLQNAVTRYDVLEGALAILQAKGIDSRPPALSKREYIELLQRTLATSPIPDTYMVRVQLEGDRSKKPYLHEIVNAVMRAFLDTAKVEQIYGSAERYSALQERQKALRAEVSGMDLQRAELAQRLGLTTFQSNTENPYDALLAQLRAKAMNAGIERSQAEANLKAFVDRGEVPSDQGYSLANLRQTDPSLVSMRTEITRRIEELNQKIAGLAAKHPARAPAEAEIRQLSDRLRAVEAEVDRRNYDSFHARFAATFEQRRAVEAGIRQSVTQLESQANEYARVFQQAMQLTRDIDNANERIQQIQKRIGYLEMESNALGFVRLVTPALPAELPSRSRWMKLMLVLLLASLCVPVVAAAGMDMLDTRIRSVNEAENLLGIPAAGWQIRREDLPTRLYADEQTRRFAGTLMRNRARNGRNVYAFTAVKALGGTTTTILDAARMLVQLGARVLVVEANTFSPFAGFGEFRPGLSELLLEDLDPATLVHPYEHEGTRLDVVGLGGRPGTGLQRLDRLRNALRVWQDRYEYVLCDLPPLLVKADAEMLIEAIGQVFLVVRAESVNRGEIGRAKRLLQKLDPEAVGLFVNQVPLFRGSGYLEQSIIETVAPPFGATFTRGARLLLQWEILRTRWSLQRAGVRRPWRWFKSRRAADRARAPDTPRAPEG